MQMKIGYVLFDSTGKLDVDGIVNGENKISTKDILNLSGANLGNFAFKNAAHKLLSGELKLISYNDDINKIKKEIDFLVMPEANFINRHVNYHKQADFVRGVDKPCLLLGAGAQASDFNEELTIPAGTLDFLKEVEKRTSSICVRGEYTKKILTNLGIKKVEALGCPSYLINPSKFLWNKIKVKANQNKALDFGFFEKTTITEGVYPVSNRSMQIDNLERALFSLVALGGADYIGQTQTSVITNGAKNFNEIKRDDMFYLKKYLCNYISEDLFYKIAKEQFKAFYKISDWINYYKNRTFVIGTRIHGNILAIQSETPALPIVHDSRTKELCQTMKIPHIDINNELLDSQSLHRLYELIEEKMSFSSKDLDTHRSALASKYKSIICELGLNPSKHLSHLSSDE